MATLTRGTTVATDTTVTAATLHNLIENALVSGVSASDLAAAVYFISAGLAAPNPSNYPVWFNTGTTDPVLKVYHPSIGIWLAVGPDRMEIPMRAMHAIPLGALVCSTGATLCYTSSSVSQHCLAVGLAQDSAASGSWLPVMVYGIGWALFTSSFSGGTQGGQVVASKLLTARGCPPGGLYSHAQTNNYSSASGPHFGIWLDNYGVATVNNTAYRAFFWGPKLSA